MNKTKNILVSACLLGINCTYSNKNNYNENIIKLLHDKNINLIPICPEQLGGLSTPREPAEISKNKIYNKKNIDVTKQFSKGANEALKIGKLYKCKNAILKERSPSCGSSFIYDGTFTHTTLKGKGITTKLFEKNEIKIFSEENFVKEFLEL